MEEKEKNQTKEDKAKTFNTEIYCAPPVFGYHKGCFKSDKKDKKKVSKDGQGSLYLCRS